MFITILLSYLFIGFIFSFGMAYFLGKENDSSSERTLSQNDIFSIIFSSIIIWPVFGLGILYIKLLEWGEKDKKE